MKIRTILCEDNDHVREIFQFILEDRGHETFAYKDAGDCPLNDLPKCKCKGNSHCADIIVSDVSMPKRSGLKFVEALRKKGCKIPHIALISGYWTEAAIANAEKMNCTVFHKPLDPNELDAWLDDCEKKIDKARKLSKKVFPAK